MIFAEAARVMTINAITEKLVDRISWEVVEGVQAGILDAIGNGQFSWRYRPDGQSNDVTEKVKEWLETLGYKVVRCFDNDKLCLEINWRKHESLG